MVKEDLIQRSPVRVFEKSLSGGLKSGEVGVIASQSGIGKTSVLVQIALDKLFQNKKVIHISFIQDANYVMAWYTDIFDEFIKKKNVANAKDIQADIVKNRVLMNFNQDGISTEMILKSLKAMIVDGGFLADVIIIDGFDFTKTNVDELNAMKKFAKELDLSVWYSCTVKGESPLFDKKGIPVVMKDFIDIIDVVIVLEAKPDHIAFTATKDHDVFSPDTMALKLDPKTLLLA
jgi:archaellum biogenesis ATPase FlaH